MTLEFKNQRILTTKILAEEFGTEEKNIQMNFSNNHTRFIEDKHYFKLEGPQLKEFKNSLPNDVGSPLKFASSLILWTERGAARHAKILDTDEAWDVYEALEETYFNVKENTLNTNNLSPELQMFNKMFQAVANVELSNNEIKNEVQAIKQSNQETKEEIQGIREITGLSSVDWQTDSKNLIVKMAHKLGGNQFINDVYKEIYSNLEKRAGCQLKIRVINKQKKMALEGVCKSKINAVSKLNIIGEEKRLLECFLAIVKEMAIKYAV